MRQDPTQRERLRMRAEALGFKVEDVERFAAQFGLTIEKTLDFIHVLDQYRARQGEPHIPDEEQSNGTR